MFVLRIRETFGALVLCGLIGGCFGGTGTITPTATGISLGLDVEYTFSNNNQQAICFYDLGDGQAEAGQLNHANDPAPTSFTYTNASYYAIHIVCATYVDVFTYDNESFYVGDSITGFNVVNVTSDIVVGITAPVLTDVVIGVEFITGTHVDMTVTLIADNLTLAVSDYNPGSIEFMTFPSSHFQTSDMYVVEVEATNPLSEETNHFILSVEQPITGVSLSSPGQTSSSQFYFMVDHNHDIITALSGENPVFVWWLLDGATLAGTAVDACDGLKTSNTFTIQHDTTGPFVLTQEIANSASFVTSDLDVSFYHKVNAFSVSISKDVVFVTDTVTFTISLASTANLRQGTVVCTVVFDDGTANQTVTFNLTTDSYAGLADSNKQKITSGKQFSVAGWYYPSINCSNELPDDIDGISTIQSFPFFVKSMYPVALIAMSHNSPNISYHALSDPFRIRLSLGKGAMELANLTCVFTYNDPKSPLTQETDILNGSSLITTIGFSRGDKEFTIQWNCSNELSSQADTITLFVYYDCWKTGTYFDEAVHHVESRRTAFTHKPYTVTGDVQVKTPYVCSLPIVSHFRVHTYDISNQQETFMANITSPESDFVSSHTFPADEMQPGYYKVYLVTAFPNESGNPLLEDYLFVEYMLDDLQISVLDQDKADNNKRSTKNDKKVVLDSYESVDPAAGLPGLSEPTRSWTCATSAALTDEEVDKYFFSGTLPATSDCSSLLMANGGALSLSYYSITGDQFTLNQWYIFKLTFSNGNRSTSKSVAVKTTEYDSIGGFQECRKGCKNATGDLFKLIGGDLNVDLTIPTSLTELDISSVTYLWTFQSLNQDTLEFTDHSSVIVDRNSRGCQILGSSIKQLTDSGLLLFQLTCTLSATDHAVTHISKQFVYNHKPYNGSCDLVFESGTPVGMSNVKGALEKVCIECSNWKDEGSRRDRSNMDDGGSLVYEIRQVFLKGDNTSDPSVGAVALALNLNMRNCFLLSITNSSVNSLTLIETRIRDSFSEPYALNQLFVNVVPPIQQGVSGAEGEKQVLEFAAEFNVILDSGVATNNTQSAVTAIIAGGKALQLEGLEGETPNTVADEELVSFLVEGEKEPDATLVVVQQVNSNLTATLANITLTDTSSSLQVIGAVNTISSGPVANLDSSSQDNLVTAFGSVSDKTSEIDLADPVNIELINDIFAAQGALSNMVVDGTLSSLETVSRDLSTAEKEFSTTNDADQTETEDESFFYSQRKQEYVQLNFEEVQNRSKELDRKSTELQKNILASTEAAISTGVQMTYSSQENSDALSVKKNKASEFLSSPITVNGASVYLGFDNVGEETEVTVALSASSKVLKLDGSNRAADGACQYKLILNSGSQLTSFTTEIKLQPMSLTTVEPFIDPEDASGFSYHLILLKSKDDMLCVAAQPSSQEILYYKVWINKPKEVAVTKVNFVAVESATMENGYSVCFSSLQRGPDIGNWRIGLEGIKQAAPSRRRRAATNQTHSLYPSYDFGVITTACMVWDDNTDSWTSSWCDGKWNITSNTLMCKCPPQMEMTFTNSFYVAPNKIDFSSVFLKFSPLNQAAVMGTLAGVIIIYILVVLWARRHDKKDLLKWGITPLLDNFAEDNYFYVIRVYTGMRPNSGTRSRIGMVIAGEDMDTGVRELFDGVRKEFCTGSVMNFLLSTNMFLGELEYLRLWHDNSGGGNFASWYLSKIEVQDVQRNETFTFLAERWLSVDDEDGSLECVLPLAKNDNINIFKNRFFINAKSSLAESHIWISVVYRPQTSNFTRVQRASCALVFIMLTMISNAMYFKSSDEPNYSTPAEVQVGPFRFSLQQVYISLQCALMTTAGTLVVIYLFKLSRNKPPTDSVLFKPKEETAAKKYRIPYIEDWMEREHEKSVKLEKHLVEKGYPKFEGFYLPYWCRYLGWLMVFVTFVVCGFFIMLYSMEWGKQKSEEWLTNFFLSFIESVLALDPVKVAVMALVFAILFRAASESSIVLDRQTIMKKYAGSQRGKSGGIRLPAPPLDHKRLDEERKIRVRELKMKRVFQDVIVQVFQIWILLSISFSNRDNKSYNMYKETQETLLDPLGQASFSEIKTIDHFYDWLNNTAIMNLFPENDYNGDRLHWRMRQFATDGAKFRVGPPRLRQVRVPKDECDIPYMDPQSCYRKYKSHIEDTDSYCIGWKAPPCDPKDAVYKFSSDAWKFTSAFDIWGLPMSGEYTTYGGGGYIAKLSVNGEVSHLIVKELYDNSWINRQTRAVIFEFTFYCLNANIFTYNMFMVEFPETGGAFPFSFILPLRVYQHTGALGKYTLACEIIFLLYLIVMTVMSIIGIYKERKAYFSKPWQVFDLVFILAGYVAIAMYIARVAMTHYALKVFRDDKKEFVNFYHVAMWDQILVLLIGILVFMAIFRLLNLLGYNKRIGAVARVFTSAAGDLFWFGLFFLMVFTCYAALGNLLFGAELTTYRNLYRTMGTLFISMIGKSKFTEIEETDPIMSKLYFMVFIFFVVYMILTMFLGILGHSISKVRKESENDKGDEMVEYMMKKFKGFLGYGGGAGDGAADRKARNLSMYTAQPAAPWNMKKGRKFEYDNRQILEDIRMSLTEAMNIDPKEFSTPEPFRKVSKKPRH